MNEMRRIYNSLVVFGLVMVILSFGSCLSTKPDEPLAQQDIVINPGETSNNDQIIPKDSDSQANNQVDNALEQVDPSDPKAVFEIALKNNPNDVGARYGQALVMLMDGKDAEAQAILLELVRTNPNFAPVHATLGSLLLAEGKTTQAKRAFEAALRLDQANPEAWGGMGRLELANGDYDKAVESLSRGMSQGPDPFLLADRGRAYGEMGNAERAEADYTQALTLLGGDVFVLLDRGRMRARSGNLQGAIEDFTEILTVDPSMILTKFYRGQVFDQLGNKPNALSDFEAVYRSKPDFTQVLEPLAILYFETGKYREASQTFARGWDDLRKNERVLLLSAATLLLSRVPGLQREGERYAQSIQPKLDQAGALYQVARSFVDSRLEPQALATIQAMDRGSEKALAQLLMAAAMVRSGSLTTARTLAGDCMATLGMETIEGRIADFIIKL